MENKMPLLHKKTPAAFKQNIKTEIAHGKPQKQAIAIAYSEKRRAEHKKHAHGGEIEDCAMCAHGGKVDDNPFTKDDRDTAKAERQVHEDANQEVSPTPAG